MEPSINVAHLSKQFEIGELKREATLRDLLVDRLRHPLRFRSSAPKMWALQDVSFTVEPGEVVGVVGRNGAGKSTLLKLLSRISYPTSGSVKVRGNVSALLEVGTGFSAELTGRENIYLSGSILGMSKKHIDARFNSIVEFAGVRQFIDTPIKRYSTGMTLRLGFAVAAHLEADVLLIDEVLAVGDADFQKKCLDTMSSLYRGKRTVLFVSHNLAAVENLCSRAIWIDHGAIRADGDPRQVISAYLSVTAAAESSEIDLRNVATRRGTGDIRFTKLEFLDSLREPAPVLRSGDSFAARLHYDVARRVEGPIFGLEIHTQLGTLVTQVHTYNDGFEIPHVPPGSGFIDVELKDVNLRPGRYNISLFTANLGHLYHDVLDYCAVLELESSARYGLGRGISKNPIISLESTWTLGQIDAGTHLEDLVAGSTYSPSVSA
jgi:lipopolysaccharide transport system ATP-binding protein